MDIRYYPLLTAALLALFVLILATSQGCYDGGVAPDEDAATQQLVGKLIVQAECDTQLGGELWAIAQFPNITELELGTLHAIGHGGAHHAMQVKNIILLPEAAAVVCTDYSPPLVHATFILGD